MVLCCLLDAVPAIEWVKLLFAALSLVGVAVGVITYRKNTALKHAEWLRSLFEKFYEAEYYRNVRTWMDCSPEEQEATHQAVSDRELADYLNFFEFIGILEKMGQLTREEIDQLFDYYLRLIKGSPIASAYVQKHGFEQVERLLRSTGMPA
ncbi:MAG TPA: hypothetical protein VHL57_04345 [Flavobacteriales bacterium]|nr:hypothetical protein [Flavobacteriales bacterium]